MALAGSFLGDGYEPKYRQIGQNLTRTCYDANLVVHSKLQPLTVSFNIPDVVSDLDQAFDAEGVHEFPSNSIESYFLLYRITHDCLYRDYGLYSLTRMTDRIGKVIRENPNQNFPIASVARIDLPVITYDHFRLDRNRESLYEALRQPSFIFAETLKVRI